MEIYDLSFNALISNLQKDVTVFTCPKTCTFITSLMSDLSIDKIKGEPMIQIDAAVQGKVTDVSPVFRCPTVYLSDSEMYCDITIITLAANVVQVIIIRSEDMPQVVDVEQTYDPYKLYYMCVGGISDLKSRMRYEQAFLSSVGIAGNEPTDERFRECVNEKIVKSLFK